MGYNFDIHYQLKDEGDLDLVASTLGILWVMNGSSAAGAGERTVTNLAGFSDLEECTWTNYVRKAIAGKTVTLNTVGHFSGWTFTTLTWSGLVVATKVVGAIIYLDGASDALRKPLTYFDTAPLFPIQKSEVSIGSMIGGSLRTTGG